MGNMLIVNAPMLFSGIWAVVKGFLDEKTRGKIKIVGSSYMSTLEQFMDIKDIPKFIGGKCECAEVPGGCINSNKGPWNDYEIHGLGIRPKQTNGEDEEAKTEEVKTEEPAAQTQNNEEGPASAQAAA